MKWQQLFTALPMCVAIGCFTAAAQAEVPFTPPAACSAKQQSGGSGTMSEGTYSVVERAIDDLSNDKYADAERRLKDLAGKVKDYERAVVYQTLGFVYAQQDQLVPALAAFEEALSEQALPQQPHQELVLNTGQIYLANGQYDKGIAVIENYLAVTCKPPPAEVHLALASAYAERKQYREALTQVNIALAKANAPQEQWLQLKLALHFELGEMRESGETLLTLISIAHKNEDYWRQLSSVLLQLERDDDSLAVLAIAERQGFLTTERDVKNLANIYLMLEIPYKAGVLLERGVTDNIVEKTPANLEYLSEAWISAREWNHAESALQSAAELGNDGDLWQRLAQVQMEKEDWKSAQTSMARAVAAKPSNPGQAAYLLGVAAFNAGDNAGARKALIAATRHESSRQQAQQWLDHLDSQSRNMARSKNNDAAVDES